MLLLAFQFIAVWTMGFNVRGRSILVLLFYLIKFIGFSYRCAIDANTGFGLSFMGFTCGVGLCEELCKAIPIAIYLNSTPKATWRDACLVGLASGVGFGVSEGITYSGSYYTGIQESWIYLVRFISCVALHALWAGAIGILMYHNQDYIGELSWENAGMFVAFYLSIGMILHGLYDTFLKSDLELGALLTAGVTFGWFAIMVNRARSAEAA
jgi:RsiW-degrading membrane proteinase PrsW (M82 family)